MLDMTGGLLTNGRTRQDKSMPEVQPMKPVQQAAPQQDPPQAPQGQPVPQQPQSPQSPQGPMQGGMPQDQQQGGMNTALNNAMMLLHDEQAAPEYEKMIAQGEEGAASAAVTIGKQLVQAYQEQGMEVNPEEMSDAIIEVIGDIAEIGMGQGSIPQEPLINGTPAGVYAVMAYASDQWAQIFPEFGIDLAAEAQQATQQDDEAARQVAAYMKQRQQEKLGAGSDQSTPGQGVNPNDSRGGPVSTAPVPM